MERRWIAVICLLGAGLAGAQTIYESKDKGGTVFSDRPSSGASSINLPPANVADAPAVAAPAPAASAASAPRYRTLIIAKPEDQGTVHTNTGAFDIGARLSPPLRPDDRVRVTLDGVVLPTLYRGTSLHISEADWRGAAIGEGNGSHVLQLVVVDAKGVAWIESPPVRFYVHRAAVGGARRR